ncbi:type II toxin-antitoxin system RelE/ParE family toxin [Methylomonas sp. HYX-M1]|uniref:type II toxin-antitoxin system RelE/ParE family toxin n=1 Tax=Methylomonas sp. HYX-M1 TaxID=3139307 RepID=UPI00345C513B
MKVVFTELARLELLDAIDYYELEFSGLGKRFQQEVKSAIKRIIQYPDAWPSERNGIRKYVMHKFPYKLIYSLEQDHILIIVVAHQHRKPDYWVDR